MTLDTALHIAVPLVTGILGVAVGWGVFKTRMTHAEKAITELKEHKVWDTQCRAQHTEFAGKIKKLNTASEGHGKALSGLQNFARWVLTKKEGLSLPEVNRIINGGD